MKRATLDLWVGLFVVAGLAALVMLAFKAGNLGTYNGSDTYQLKAYFDNIGGLKPQASIRSAGVLVGRVTSIKLHTQQDDHEYQAEVTMKVDHNYKFPKSTSANILTSGLLGEQYIGLAPNLDPDRTYADSDMLNDGDEFKKVASAIVLEDLIGKFLYSEAAGGSKK
jgi:phospholipid/cholesterol/gamma-HCH transport system substrate-binding protein